MRLKFSRANTFSSLDSRTLIDNCSYLCLVLTKWLLHHHLFRVLFLFPLLAKVLVLLQEVCLKSRIPDLRQFRLACALVLLCKDVRWGTKEWRPSWSSNIPLICPYQKLASIFWRAFILQMPCLAHFWRFPSVNWHRLRICSHQPSKLRERADRRVELVLLRLIGPEQLRSCTRHIVYCEVLVLLWRIIFNTEMMTPEQTRLSITCELSLPHSRSWIAIIKDHSSIRLVDRSRLLPSC